MREKTDLTSGSVWKSMLAFAVPLFIGNLFQQFYGIADTAVVGNVIGKDALTAVGTASSAMSLVTGLSMGLSTGSNIVISQCFGAKRYGETRTAVNTALRAFLVLGVIASIVGLLLINPLLSLLQTPTECLAYAQQYLRIAFLGAIFIMMYNILNQISIATGDSQTPMLMLIIASVMNVILDILFAAKLNMGIGGVALATVIGQGFSAVTCFMILNRRMKNLCGDQAGVGFDRAVCGQMFKLGLPSMLQTGISSSGVMAMQGLMNSLGSNTAAAFVAANKIDGIAMTPMVSLGTAMGTFSAQNIGAKKTERVKEGMRFNHIFAVCICIVLGIVIFSIGGTLLGLFLKADTAQEVIDIGIEYLHVAVFSYAVMAFMFITTGVLRGAGDVKVVFVSAMLDLGCRVLFAYACVGFMGRYAVWLSYPFGWFCSCVLAYSRYFSKKWMNIKVLKD